jgi:hypothetical protein
VPGSASSVASRDRLGELTVENRLGLKTCVVPVPTIGNVVITTAVNVVVTTATLDVIVS